MKLDNQTLGDWIRDLRLSLGQTKREFAKTVGVCERAVAYWEANERVPAEPTLKYLLVLYSQHKLEEIRNTTIGPPT